MAQPLKICALCLALSRETEDGQLDLAVYLKGTGAGGVEIVPAGACQARLAKHSDGTALSFPAGRGLADVTPEELESAIASFLKQIQLPSGRCGDVWDLENAIKAEWLKAQEIRGHNNNETSE